MQKALPLNSKNGRSSSTTGKPSIEPYARTDSDKLQVHFSSHTNRNMQEVDSLPVTLSFQEA